MPTLLSSSITSVTVYETGATVTRSAEVPEAAEGEVRIAGLPIALMDESVRVRFVDDESASATIRVRLATTTDSEGKAAARNPALDEAELVLAKAEATVAALQAQHARLESIQIFVRPAGEEGKPPPPSPTRARLELVSRRAEEIAKTEASLAEAREQRRIARTERDELAAAERERTTDRAPRDGELRKCVDVSLARAAGARRIELTYEVPCARWFPRYTLRVGDDLADAELELRGVVAQSSGEDWANVPMRLSTARRTSWRGLPKLHPIRIGRAQPDAGRKGWRPAPTDTRELFGDFLEAVKRRALRPGNLTLTLRGSGGEREVSFNKGHVTIGSASHNDLRLDGPGVADRHARIEFVDGAYYMHAASAESRIWSGDARVTRTVLAYDTHYRIGRHMISVQALPGSAERSPASTGAASGRAQARSDLRTTKAQPMRPPAPPPPPAAPVPMPAGAAMPASPPAMVARQSAPQAELAASAVAKPQMRSAPRGAKKKSRARMAMKEEAASFGGGGDLGTVDFMMADEGATGSVELPGVSAPSDMLRYGQLIMRNFDHADSGELQRESMAEAYSELFVRTRVRIDIQQTLRRISKERRPPRLPPQAEGFGATRQYDYAYESLADGLVLSDGRYHSVPLLRVPLRSEARFICVPRESTDVFRELRLTNSSGVPLFEGGVDIYVGGQFLISSRVPPAGPDATFTIGLGTEQAIKVARNTTFEEESKGLIRGRLHLKHRIAIDVANHRGRDAVIEVRERIPVPHDPEGDVKVDVRAVDPAWKPFEQVGHEVEGAHHWVLTVPDSQKRKLSVEYTVIIPPSQELAGGNRRER